MQAIPDLLRRAIHYETEAPRVAKRGCEGVPPVHGHVRVGETLYRVKITVRKQTNGLRFYDQHSVEMADPDVVSAAQDSRRATSAVHPAAGVNIIVGDLFRDVNYADGSPVEAGGARNALRLGPGPTTLSEAFARDTEGLERELRARMKELGIADLIAAGLSPFSSGRERWAANRLFLREINHYVQRRVDFAFETTLSGRSYPRLIRQ